MLSIETIFKNEDNAKLTYDNQLQEYLDQYDDKNGFVFANIIMKDHIKDLPDTPKFFCIVNYDTSDKSGSHWVAIIKDKNLVFYFDSYGMIPIKEVKNRFPTEKVIYNDYAVQKINSNICGHLCIAFIEHIVVKEKSFYSFLTECEKYSKRYKNDIKQ